MAPCGLVGDGDLLFIASNEASGPPLDNIGRAWQRHGVADDLAKTSGFDPFSVLNRRSRASLKRQARASGWPTRGGCSKRSRAVRKAAPSRRSPLRGCWPQSANTNRQRLALRRSLPRSPATRGAPSSWRRFWPIAATSRGWVRSSTKWQGTSPDREGTSYYAAMLSFLTGNFPEAIAHAERVVEKNPHHALALNLIGSASARLGRHDRAREAFRASLRASPQEPSTYANLGLLEMESGNRDAAVAYFAESLTLDPHQEVARAYLPAALAGTKP